MTDEGKRLVESLREHAEWAKRNEWETPITLSDDLSAAADLIENLMGRLSAAAGLLEELTDNMRAWQERAVRAESEMDALFYETARLRSR